MTVDDQRPFDAMGLRVVQADHIASDQGASYELIDRHAPKPRSTATLVTVRDRSLWIEDSETV